jgi:hypothetical protein
VVKLKSFILGNCGLNVVLENLSQQVVRKLVRKGPRLPVTGIYPSLHRLLSRSIANTPAGILESALPLHCVRWKTLDNNLRSQSWSS